MANVRVHGTTGVPPIERIVEERTALQPLAPPWRGDIAGARPQREAPEAAPGARPVVVLEHIESTQPAQHPLAVYDRLLKAAQPAREVVR